MKPTGQTGGSLLNFWNGSWGIPNLFRLKRFPGMPVEAANTANYQNRRAIPDLDTDSRYLIKPYDLSKLRSVARWAYQNDGFTRHAVRQICRSVIGTNLAPQAKTNNPKWNKQAEDYFALRSRVLDITQRLTWTEMLRSWLAGFLVLGDQGIQLTSVGNFGVVKSIQPHRIADWGYNYFNGYFNGVKVDDVGRPVAYRVLQGDMQALNYSLGEAVDIPSSDFILFYDPDFADDYRGLCQMGSEVLNVIDYKTIISLERRGVEANLAPAIINYTQEGDDDLLTNTRSNPVDGEKFRYDPVTGGLVLNRKLGDKVEMVQPARPTPGLGEFGKILREPVALALGVPIQWVLGDYSNSGTGIRMVVSQAERRIAELQALMRDRVLNRIWFYIISKAIKNGELPENEEKYKVDWQWPQDQTADNGRDSKAALMDLAGGLHTYQADYAERGKDWRPELRQRALEEQYIDELAKEFKITPERIRNFAPQQSAQPEQNAGAPDPANQSQGGKSK